MPPDAPKRWSPEGPPETRSDHIAEAVGLAVVVILIAIVTAVLVAVAV